MNKNNLFNIVCIALFLVLVLALWMGFSFVLGPELVQLPADAAGGYDLIAYDFSDTVYRTAEVWDSWPEQILTPQELSSAGAPVPQTSIDTHRIQYATHRLVLRLVPGARYGVTMLSSDYAMRLYINGEEIGAVGVPGSSREGTVPRTRQVTYYFTAQNETTEFVAQASNFVHRVGAYAPMLTVGTEANIMWRSNLAAAGRGVIFGGLLMVALYRIAIFILNRRQKTSLIFAVLCLLLAAMPANMITLAFPGYNWQIVFRVEYLCNISICATLMLLVTRLFPNSMHRRAPAAFYIFCGIYFAVVLFTSTLFFSRILIVYQIVAGAVGIYAIVMTARRLRPWDAKKTLAFAGLGAVILFNIQNQLYKIGFEPFGIDIGRGFNVTAGMIIYIFCTMLALAIEQAEVNRNYESAAAAVAEAEARYAVLLEQARGMERDLTAAPPRLSDFGLSRRETDVALLLLDGKSRDEIAALLYISRGTVNTHCTNIYRKSGCGGGLTEFMQMMKS